MKGSKWGSVWSFFSAATACLVSGTALAQCFFNGTLPSYPTPGEVPCYIQVQPIDVCGTSGTSTCAPFNTVSAVGNPSTAGKDSAGNFNNSASQNPIGFTVDPATGASPPPAGDTNGVDITRVLLNQLGVDLTWLPMATYNSKISPLTNNTYQTLNVRQPTGTTILQSDDFLALSFQKQISQGIETQSPNPVFPSAPLGVPSNIVNMFFVSTLNPPTPGTLYGFSWICNNGVAIAQNTFGFPRSRTSPPPRPDTIVHELGHNLCLDHPIFGAGPWTPPPYSSPGGVVPLIPVNPLVGECDPSYPACGRNLMTTGSLRTEPTVACVLAGFNGLSPPAACVNSTGTQLPSLLNGNADEATTPLSASSTQLPLSQQAKVLTGGSGLLFQFADPPMKSGFLNPIPRETTKVEIDTGGSSTDPIIFDLSGPAGGRPGATLVAWILTLPEEQSFAKHSRFHIISQTREDLVQDVDYYPDAENNPLRRNIAYNPDADNNPDDPNVGPAAHSPCTSATAECLIVKFQLPGLGAHDSISFSKGILSGGAAITNDDLCKAKVTYIFSDGYATTSNFRPCPAISLSLIASSWRPDPTVGPQIVKRNVLLAQSPPLPCTPVPGSDPPSCENPEETGLSDADPRFEGGQPGQSCNNGEMNGTIQGNVTVSTGQYWRFTNPCEIKGNLMINGGSVYLNCAVDGNLTENGGTLKLDAMAHVFGNVQISQASAFSIGPSVAIDGNLQIQNLPKSEPQPGTICGTQVKGNLVAKNNLSPIQIGETPMQQNCPGNTISGNLQCTGNNPVPTSGSNVVAGHNQCSG